MVGIQKRIVLGTGTSKVAGTDPMAPPMVGTDQMDRPTIGTDLVDPPIVGTDQLVLSVTGMDQTDLLTIGTVQMDLTIGTAQRIHAGDKATLMIKGGNNSIPERGVKKCLKIPPFSFESKTSFQTLI